MSETDELRAGCDVTLGFPHDGDSKPAGRLRAIADYIEQRGWGDDTYLGGPLAEELERHVASLTGQPAALWFPTGTMAQGVAALIHAAETERDTLLLHPSSHLELHERHGYREAHHLKAELTGEWRRVVCAADVRRAEAGPAAVFIELPARHSGGALPEWDELLALRDAAHARGARLHVDGARLWTCTEAYPGKSLADIGGVADSVYVSFYKDIGALGGAALCGSEEFIEQAKIWRERLGGLLIRGWPMMADALRLLPERLGRMPAYVARANLLSAKIAEASGFEIEPAPPRTAMFHVRMPMTGAMAQAARDHAARESGVWIANRFWGYEADDIRSAEITVGERVMAADPNRVAAAFAAMADYAGKNA
ncbi:beta-eliminating lyase-related protein [Hyphobacterium sp. SN044]|uniref:threonine aldolase family protein n=1 Tax=Hyphobacterium sp. SN044 TaxID=2912575 RepID=UPI001F012B19|nr:beta-eliminating lyase-related protein [Hyphobacterium sp. SN044]MCF8880752.1 beta-eliminating lyase-related protein [Hyphobacterium sp. SN044]